METKISKHYYIIFIFHELMIQNKSLEKNNINQFYSFMERPRHSLLNKAETLQNGQWKRAFPY